MKRDRMRSPVNVQMLQEIQAINFALLETVLYLDTHPESRVVLDKHNELARRLNRLTDQYQKEYGPLYPSYEDADYPWSWIDSPWPWEIEY